MQLFALDLGNRQVKLMSEKATKVLPSYFVNAAEYGKRDVLALGKKEKEQTTSDYVTGRDADFTYVWGTGLDINRKRVTDTLDFNRRYDTLEFKVLADLALTELARDFKESTKSAIDVAVVTGVPTDDYDNDETIKHIRNALIGVHSASIDGVDHYVHVRSVDVLMQPVGTAIDAMVDALGNIKEDNDIEDGYIGVVDVGGGTVIINAFDKMNLDTKHRVQMEDGSYSLFTEIRNRIIDKGYKISEHEVEQIVRDGNDKEVYTWSPNGRETLDFTDMVMKERKLYTRNIAQSVKSTFKAMSSMRKIYVTGGTANLLIKDEFTRVVKIAHFVNDSETANVRGYYKYGLINEVTAVDEATN